MRKMIFRNLIGLVLLLLISCSKSELGPREFINWCDDLENELIAEFKQGDIKLTCQYMTAEYSVLKQSDPNHLIKSQIESEILELQGLYQFKLTFENTESNNFLKNNYTTGEEFNTSSSYLSYGMQTDLSIVSGLDTIQCNLNHHERTYGNTPFETVLISFPRLDQTNQSLTLIFNDRVFGLGRVKFFFDEGVFKDCPELVL